MNAIEKLEKYIKDEGITQISGGIFEDQIRKRLIDTDEETGELIYESYQVKANTTVAEYCREMGLITAASSMGYHTNEEPVTAEEYAKELLGFMTAPSKNIVGECRKCFKFLIEFEDDNHEEFCNGRGYQSIDSFLPDSSFKFNDSRKMTEIERLEKSEKSSKLPEQVEKVSPDANEIICRHLAKAEPFTKKEGDTSGNLREVESVEEVGELARASGERLKKIFEEDNSLSPPPNPGNDYDKPSRPPKRTFAQLNEIAIDNAIANGKAKEFKFNDSTKKKGAFEEFLDDAGDDIEVDYSRGFKR